MEPPNGQRRWALPHGFGLGFGLGAGLPVGLGVAFLLVTIATGEVHERLKSEVGQAMATAEAQREERFREATATAHAHGTATVQVQYARSEATVQARRCDHPDGVVIGDPQPLAVSRRGVLGTSVMARVRNTCNYPVRVRLQIVAFTRDGQWHDTHLSEPLQLGAKGSLSLSVLEEPEQLFVETFAKEQLQPPAWFSVAPALIFPEQKFLLLPMEFLAPPYPQGKLLSLELTEDMLAGTTRLYRRLAAEGKLYPVQVW